MREYIQVKDPNSWTEPSDWPDINTANDNEILILASEGGGWGFICKVGDGTGTFSVDWGDGTIVHNQVGDGIAICEHEHLINGTWCSEGYETWKVRVYNASANIKIWKLSVLERYGEEQSPPILSVNFGAAYIEDFSNTFSMGVILLNGAISLSTKSINCCYKLKKCRIKSFQNCTTTSLCFASCLNMKSAIIPDSWGNVTTARGMFHKCYSIEKLKLPTNWGQMQNLEAFLYYNFNLQNISIPTSWGNVQDISYMFYACYNLQSITLPHSWGAIKTISNTFRFCSSISRLTLPISWDLIEDITNAFRSLNSLKSLILPSTFGDYIKYVPGAIMLGDNLSYIANLDKLGSLVYQCAFTDFLSCYLPENNHDIVVNSLLSAFTIVRTAPNTLKANSIRLLNQGSLFAGSNPQISIIYTTLSKSALETLFGDIPVGLVSKTIAITGCTGTDALISKTSSGTTANSTTITMANTSLLAAEMEVYGTGISTAKAVTFTDTGDLVNRTAHGLSNGMKISFSSITSTTGIVVNTTYFVVNKTNDTFQVSLTLDGSAIALTTNGSGNLIAIPTIVTINAGVSIVIDVPCSATASVTLTAGVLKRSIALLKGWTITN